MTREEWKNDFKGFINMLSMPKDDYNGIMDYIDKVPNEGRWVLGEGLSEEPCEDAISRQAVLDLAKERILVSEYEYKVICHLINKLPSVKLQPKTGHWIKIKPYPLQMHDYKCSECGHETDNFTENYCSECGAKMVEPKSEG